MDEYEENCDGLQVKSQYQENYSEGVKLKLKEGYESSRCTESVSVNQLPLIKHCNAYSLWKSYEYIEDLGIKTIPSKTSDCEAL